MLQKKTSRLLTARPYPNIYLSATKKEAVLVDVTQRLAAADLALGSMDTTAPSSKIQPSEASGASDAGFSK